MDNIYNIREDHRAFGIKLIEIREILKPSRQKVSPHAYRVWV